MSLQGNYVMENWENSNNNNNNLLLIRRKYLYEYIQMRKFKLSYSSSLRTSRQQVRKTYLNNYLANDKLTLTKT